MTNKTEVMCIDYGKFPSNIVDAAKEIVDSVGLCDNGEGSGDAARLRIAALGAMISSKAIRDMQNGVSDSRENPPSLSTPILDAVNLALETFDDPDGNYLSVDENGINLEYEDGSSVELTDSEPVEGGFVEIDLRRDGLECDVVLLFGRDDCEKWRVTHG